MDNIISLLTPKSITFYLNEGSTVRQALEIFDAHKFSIVPIIDSEGKYKGTISQGDILRVIKEQPNFNAKLAENILIENIDHYRPYRAVKIDAMIAEVFALSQEQNFVPVVDDQNTYIGIIKRKDIISYLLDKYNLIPH